MNILVTGANGQLGNEMRLFSSSSEDNFIFTDINEVSEESGAILQRLGASPDAMTTVKLDITDLDAIRKIVANNHIDVLVNCAAYTNVEAAEDHLELAELLNATAVELLAKAMKEQGGLLVHISTDYIFGKEPYNCPCREEQKGTPVGNYGLTKLHGEQAILESGCESVIIRTAWLYSEFGNNFVKTIQRLCSSKESINVVFDQTGTPTYAGDLAELIMTVIADYKDSGKGDYSGKGIYHFSNEGVCSWFDFAKFIQEYSFTGKSCDIKPCHSDEFPSKVTRPAYSVLDKSKVKAVFDIRIPYWTDSLKKCISSML